MGGRKNWRFSSEMADISETVRDRTMVTMERYYEVVVVVAGSIGIIFDDLE